MEISSRNDGDVTIINLQGRLDMMSAADLKNVSRECINKGDCRLILNMGRVDFINSSGLGALVSLLKDVRNTRGRLRLTNLAPYVKEIFDITKLSNIFEICDDEKRACDSF